MQESGCVSGASSGVCDCRREDVVQDLYRSMGRAVLSKILHIVGQNAVAEELLQDTFIKLWQSGIVFPNQRAAYGWLYRTGHNASIDFLRSGRHRYEGATSARDYDSVAYGSGAIEESDRVADREQLEALLQRLSEREAQILVYREVDGMTGEEIATLLGVSRKTVVRAWAMVEQKVARIRAEMNHAAKGGRNGTEH